MPTSFPPNPAVGDVFVGPYGARFYWDGQKWAPPDAIVVGTGYLPLTGGTMLGEIQFVVPQDVAGPQY
jgi:hypothetical protein